MWSMISRINGRLCSCVVAMILILGTVACRDSAPLSPSSPYAGSWAGTLVDGSAGNGTWQMTLSEVSVLTGRGAMTLDGQVASGLATELPPPPGTSGRFLNLSCGPGRGDLLVNVTVTMSAITGTYQSLGCAGFSSGTLRGQRQ